MQQLSEMPDSKGFDLKVGFLLWDMTAVVSLTVIILELKLQA